MSLCYIRVGKFDKYIKILTIFLWTSALQPWGICSMNTRQLVDNGILFI